MAEEFVFKISHGVIETIYDDRLADFLAAGKTTITRASFVEPDPRGGWSADLAPSGGPILGPFALREEALAAEKAWLERKMFT